MAIYKTHHGYGVDWRDEFGARHRKFVGDQTAARLVEQKIIHGILEARSKLSTLRAGPTLSLLPAADLFLAHTAVAKNTRARYRRIARSLAAHSGDHPLGQITPNLLGAFLAFRATQLAPATLALEAGALKNLFSWLHAQAYIPADPAREIRITRPQPNPPKPISYDQEAEILAHFEPRPILKILLGLDAGLRDGEIIRLRRNHLDFKNSLLHVHASKPHTVQLRIVPITARLHAALLAHASHLAPDSLLFTHAARQQSRASGFLYTARKRTEFIFRMHQLRHTFATRIAAVAPNPFIVSTLLGHSPHTLSWRGQQLRFTTPRYVHPALEELRAAILEMENRNPNSKKENQKCEPTS